MTAAEEEEIARAAAESKAACEKNERWLRERGDLVAVAGARFPMSQTLAKSLGYASHPNEQEHEHG